MRVPEQNLPEFLDSFREKTFDLRVIRLVIILQTPRDFRVAGQKFFIRVNLAAEKIGFRNKFGDDSAVRVQRNAFGRAVQINYPSAVTSVNNGDSERGREII